MKTRSEVAVIGGTGFIGRELVSLLVRGGSNVAVASRGCGDREAEPGLRFIAADVSEPGGADRAIAGAEVVYHLAAGFGQRWRDFERIVQGARLTAEACAKHGVRRLIYTSSIAALYLGRRGQIDDGAAADPQSLRRSHYARAKAESERVLLDAHAARGLPVVILRPGVVVGRGGPATVAGLGQWPSDTCCIGWGRGRNPLPFVLVEDVATAMFLAKDAPALEGRTFNLVGDVRPSAREFVRLLAQRSRRNYRFYGRSLVWLQALEIGKWALKCAARKAENPFPSYRDLRSRSLITQFDCRMAKEVLGWEPVSDRETFLARAIDVHIPPPVAGDLRFGAHWVWQP